MSFLLPEQTHVLANEWLEKSHFGSNRFWTIRTMLLGIFARIFISERKLKPQFFAFLFPTVCPGQRTHFCEYGFLSSSESALLLIQRCVGGYACVCVYIIFLNAHLKCKLECLRLVSFQEEFIHLRSESTKNEYFAIVKLTCKNFAID